MRVTTSKTTRARHKKILKMAKGYRGARSRRFRTANEAVMKSLVYAYRDRRTKKREIRALWIIRMNAALRELGTKYSAFIANAKDKNVKLDRKVLASIAVEDKETFKKIVEFVNK